jgi:hypothetical protein
VHPRLESLNWIKDVDGRDEPGHDDADESYEIRLINSVVIPGRREAASPE